MSNKKTCIQDLILLIIFSDSVWMPLVYIILMMTPPPLPDVFTMSCTLFYLLKNAKELITETQNGSPCPCSGEKAKKKSCTSHDSSTGGGHWFFFLHWLCACVSQCQQKTDGGKDMRCMYRMHRCVRALYVEEFEIMPGSHLPHPCSFWHPLCPLRHTAASHHKPNRLNPSGSTCCAN